MTKQEFMKELKFALRRCEHAEVERVLDYYDEIIMERVESGKTEAEVIDGLDRIDIIARNVERDITAGERHKEFRAVAVEAKDEPTPRNWGKVVALALASPVALPISIALWAVVVSLVIATAAVVLGMVIAGFSLVAAGAAVTLAGIPLGIMSGQPMVFFAYLGVGLLVFVLGIWIARVTYLGSRLVFKVSAGAIGGVVKLFGGKKGKSKIEMSHLVEGEE